MRERLVFGQPVWPIPWAVFVLLLLSVLGVVLYNAVGHSYGWTFMEDPFGSRGWMYGWPTSHLVLFFLLGVVAPRHWFVIWLLSVAWELAEFGFGHLWKEYNYWYSIRFDIVLNTMGLVVGATLSSWLRRRKAAKKSSTAAAAMFLVALTVTGIMLFANDAWSYVLDRSLDGEFKKAHETFVSSCGVTNRCNEVGARLKLAKGSGRS
jgi:hypothetical protein